MSDRHEEKEKITPPDQQASPATSPFRPLFANSDQPAQETNGEEEEVGCSWPVSGALRPSSAKEELLEPIPGSPGDAAKETLPESIVFQIAQSERARIGRTLPEPFDRDESGEIGEEEQMEAEESRQQEEEGLFVYGASAVVEEEQPDLKELEHHACAGGGVLEEEWTEAKEEALREEVLRQVEEAERESVKEEHRYAGASPESVKWFV